MCLNLKLNLVITYSGPHLLNLFHDKVFEKNYFVFFYEIYLEIVYLTKF